MGHSCWLGTVKDEEKFGSEVWSRRRGMAQGWGCPQGAMVGAGGQSVAHWEFWWSENCCLLVVGTPVSRRGYMGPGWFWVTCGAWSWATSSKVLLHVNCSLKKFYSWFCTSLGFKVLWVLNTKEFEISDQYNLSGNVGKRTTSASWRPQSCSLFSWFF